MSNIVQPIDSHPGLMKQKEIDKEVQNNPYFPDEEMSVDQYYEWSVSTVSENDEWHIFKHKLTSGSVFVWNKMYGYGFKISAEEGCWEKLVQAIKEVEQS